MDQRNYPWRLIAISVLLGLTVLAHQFYGNSEEDKRTQLPVAYEIVPDTQEGIESIQGYDKETVSASPKGEINEAIILSEQDSPHSESNLLVTEKYPIRLNINFPSGGSLDLSFKLNQSYFLPKLDPNNSTKYVNDLVSLTEKEGNAEAADELSQFLDVCAEAPKTDSALNQALVALTNTNGVSGAEGIFPDAESLSYYHGVCKGIDGRLIESRIEWQKKALELGSFRAIANQANELIGSDHQTRSELLQRGWELGHLTLGSSIALDYYNGTIPSLEGTPDPVTGFAYQLAQDTALKHLWQQSGSLSSSQQIAQLDQALSLISANFSHAQLEKAESLAIELLKNNNNCCIGNWGLIEEFE